MGEKKFQIGVKILLRNSKGQFLLGQRNAEKYRDIANKWDIVGGRVEDIEVTEQTELSKEVLVENLLREIKQETGLELTASEIDNIEFLFEQTINLPNRKITRKTFFTEITDRPVHPTDAEHIALKWLSREEIAELQAEGHLLPSFAEKYNELVEMGFFIPKEGNAEINNGIKKL